MHLCDRDLKAELSTDKDLSDLSIDPYDPALVQPASVDVRLGSSFRVMDNHKYPHIDPAQPQEDLTRLVEVQQDGVFVLHPGEFVLGTTLERVRLSTRLAARLEGKSSLGRLGLLTHATAGFIDPGFEGFITLELFNVATLPIKLYPGMRIGQLCVVELTGFVETPYGSSELGSRYQGQEGPTASRMYEGFSTAVGALYQEDGVDV